MCTSWFLLCWRQHLIVGVAGSESGQLSESAEHSLARPNVPARVPCLRTREPIIFSLVLSLARGGALPAHLSSLSFGSFFFWDAL